MRLNKSDFMAAIAKNIHDMHDLMLNYEYVYSQHERSLIYDIARKINRYNPVLVPESNNPINEKDLYKNFLTSLEQLDSDYIYDYYVSVLKRIKLIRSRVVAFDEAELEYEINHGKATRFNINMPNSRLIITNQIAFAHEMGHIPEIDVIRKSFLEHNEVIPMFFEFIASLDCYGQKDGKENFICDSLTTELNVASNLMKLFKKCETKDNIERTRYIQLFADDYKFFESLDYALQLIDIYEQDSRVVVDEIERVINGKSLIDVASDLEIDTSGCKRLLKEYKN